MPFWRFKRRIGPDKYITRFFLIPRNRWFNIYSASLRWSRQSGLRPARSSMVVIVHSSVGQIFGRRSWTHKIQTPVRRWNRSKHLESHPLERCPTACRDPESDRRAFDYRRRLAGVDVIHYGSKHQDVGIPYAVRLGAARRSDKFL